jgi:hypothetical protein
MRKFSVLFIASLTFGCFEPTDSTPADGTESNAGSETMAGTTHSASTTADSTTSPDDAGTSNTQSTGVDSTDTGADTTTTETGTPVMGCHGTPTPCETFGVGEHDACVDTDGCTSVLACDGRPALCAAAEGCPGTAAACIDNCEAKPGCGASNPIYCPGQAPPQDPSCYQCIGTPTPCADVDDSNTCTDVGCTWGHQACEGTPVACETYDDVADCAAQPGCTWDE